MIWQEWFMLTILKDDHQEKMLRKICIGLGFLTENVKYIVDKALTLVGNGVDFETFRYEMKNMNNNKFRKAFKKTQNSLDMAVFL